MMKFSEKRPACGARQTASFLLAVALLVASAGLCSSACSKSRRAKERNSKARQAAAEALMIEAIPFKELNGSEVYNASGIVALADSRFLFCDNNTNDALYELRLTDDGQQQGALVRRPLQGLEPGAIDDLEDMTLVEEAGRRYLFITSSMYVKQKKHTLTVPPSGLLRVMLRSGGPDDSLSAENLPGFRAWLLKAYPQLAAAAEDTPDDGGLNIEGLTWDRHRRALLFGVRTPVPPGRLLLLPVRVKDFGGPWELGSLEALPPIQLTVETAEGEQGIRGLSYEPERNGFLILTGKSRSDSKAPFALYEWSGQAEAAPQRRSLGFAKKMKPEGLTRGTVGGKGALVIVDDGGGFRVVWDDADLSSAAPPRL